MMGASAAERPRTLIFRETNLKDAFVIDPERREDDRGFFARTFCQDEFAEHGLNPLVAQCSVSFNRRKGTLRGLHYQAAPHEEAKLVRCTQGAIFDVIVDLRRNSPTFKKHFAMELSSTNHTMLYIPAGFAHGFQTLLDETEVFYQMSKSYHAESARGVRWDDPVFGISWPYVEHRILLERDRNYPLFVE